MTIGEAREKIIAFLTAHWEQSLVALAGKLQKQGFSQEETLSLCEGFRPMFEKNLTEALLQFDQDADSFIAGCAAMEVRQMASRFTYTPRGPSRLSILRQTVASADHPRF